MSLFSLEYDNTVNLLPKDGIVNYYGIIFSNSEANAYFKTLLSSIEWENDEIVIFGKKIITKRKTAWYGNNAYQYTYSKITKTALPWTKELFELKLIIEKLTGETYNSCLLNLYHSGEEGMSWHSDDEDDLKQHSAIASLSFGASRKFSFKHKKSKDKVDLILENGSLLVMTGTTQQYWLHCIPKSKKVFGERINLTFRSIKEN